MNKYPTATLILLSLFCLKHVSGKACSMCYDGSAIKSTYANVVLDSDENGQYTCEQYATTALTIDEADVKCESYYRLIGKARCGCPRPPVAPRVDEVCHICMNGALPPENNVIDMKQLGNWGAGGITCLEARDYLINFFVSEDSCMKFHQLGVQNCGCTDLLPTPSPTTSPTFVDQVKIDCDALANGIFPTINSDYVGSTNISYNMGLQLAEGYKFDDIAGPLQNQMDIIISLDVNDHCSSSSVRRLVVQRNLGDVIIHYVDFENLRDGGGGVATGDAKVVHSILPERNRGRNLIQEDAFKEIITESISKNSEKISSSVEGVAGVTAGPTPEQKGGNEGVVIGVSVGCAVIALAAGILVSKKRGGREDATPDLDRVEFLPSAQTRSDEARSDLLPPFKLRSDKSGIEVCPEDYSSVDSDQRNVVMSSSSSAMKMDADPGHDLNNTFPIKHPTYSKGRFEDSDSSDSDVQYDDNDEKRPIAVRRKTSYDVRSTMIL